VYYVDVSVSPLVLFLKGWRRRLLRPLLRCALDDEMKPGVEGSDAEMK